MILVHAEVRRKQKAVRPELVEGLFCLLTSLNEERCFDRLSTNGEKESPRRRVNQMPSYRQGGAFSPCGLAVKISHPVSVMPMLCSNCADRLRSRVTAVQPSFSIFTAYLPVFIIGSMVKNMPGRSSGPVPGRPAWTTSGASWNICPTPWPQKSRTTE